MRKKNVICFAISFFSICSYAQFGINTPNPQGVFNIDGAKDNSVTSTPTLAQQANDVVVTSAGHLGVGTVVPNVPMHIFRNSSANEYVFRIQNNLVNTAFYLGSGTDHLGVGSWFGTVSKHPFYLMANDIGALIINPNDFTIKAINGYSIVTSSDRRLKKNIQSIVTDIVKTKAIENLTPVQYEMTDNKEGRSEFGFIAQDLEKIYPNLVFTDENGYKSVNYIGLIPILTAELKNQKKEIEELKNKIKRLPKKNNSGIN